MQLASKEEQSAELSMAHEKNVLLAAKLAAQLSELTSAKAEMQVD